MADKARLHRSELAVPGTNRRAIEKAPTLGADLVFLDLEDAVAPDEKERARANVIDALGSEAWRACAVSVRVNGLDTPWCYRDVVDVVEARGDVLASILVPKVGAPSDVAFVATLLDQIEQRNGWEPGRIGIHVLIETAAGMANVESIARARPDRLEALVFGVADFAASVGARTTQMGGANADYAVLTDPDADGRRDAHWGDQWHAALSRIVVAARAEGLRPIDGPFGAIDDPDGFRAAARRAAALGCEGKWAIHPSQVALANEVFTPGEAEVERAERILEAMETAAKEGKGAVALDGRLIDAASIRQAERLMRKVEQMRSR
ncbi:MAG TPA: CoA ester lyase [Actinomycetota bacterium]